MDKVNLGLAKFLQLIVIVFFTFGLAVYFGSLLLIPLAILIGIVDILTAIGFNGIFATIVALPAVGWVCYTVYNIPGLFQSLVDTGMKLYNLSIEQNKAFESITKGMQPEPVEEAASETTQKSETAADDNNTPTAKPA